VGKGTTAIGSMKRRSKARPPRLVQSATVADENGTGTNKDFDGFLLLV
jgi:hypothetical protein